MRDGEHRECPIVDNEPLRINLLDKTLVVAAQADSIQMFPDPRYTHLRYWDTDDEDIKVVFLPEDVLADLADAGIPVCIRNEITRVEYEAWLEMSRKVGSIALQGDEPLALMPGDPIDAEVQSAMAKFDAEADFYLYHEWGGDAGQNPHI